MNKYQFLFLTLMLFSCGKDDFCSSDPARCHTYTEPTCEELSASKAPIIGELRDKIHPITGSSPTLPKEELIALDAVIGEAQFIGLGEATHGTLEFFEMKDRIFRYLVEEHGFKAIGFEATWGGSLYVNNYVLNGIGTARTAISKMQFWTWNTEEVLALVEWMREYNLGREDEDKIHFYGFDIQSGSEELYWLETFLEPINSELRREITQILNPFINAAVFATYNMLPVAEQLRYQDDILEAKALYKMHEDEIIAAAGRKQYELYAYAFEVLQMFEDVIDENTGTGKSRDSYMATNSQWIAEYLGGGARIALWAHNGHISKNYVYKSQGSFLNDQEGENYRNIGFSFGKGTFQAINTSTERLTNSNEVIEVNCNTTESIFEEMDADYFYLLKNDLLSNDILSEYFDSNQNYVNIGAVYNDDVRSYIYLQNLAKSFDAMIYFSNTNAAKGL